MIERIARPWQTTLAKILKTKAVLEAKIFISGDDVIVEETSHAPSCDYLQNMKSHS